MFVKQELNSFYKLDLELKHRDYCRFCDMEGKAQSGSFKDEEGYF